MDECTHLIRDYLCKNPTAINWGYYVMSEDDLSQALHQLKSFDRPDMYAILKDKIIIIEHFEFDASVCSRKGIQRCTCLCVTQQTSHRAHIHALRNQQAGVRMPQAMHI